MKCYNPRLAFVNANGGRPIFTKYTWSQFIHAKKGFRAPLFPSAPNGCGAPLKMPCGKCEACRLEQARDRAVRCVHEFKSHGDKGAFLTLTYNPENLPLSGSYDESDIVLFVKRLRKHLAPLAIKTFGCAEYGDKGSRPHFHLLIFGFDFPDRIELLGSAEHGSGHSRYRSPLLERLWTKGFSEIGSITPESASYVARYTQKKCKKKDVSYKGLLPEKAVCVSRRPGLGKKWFERFHDDWYRNDAVTVDGVKQAIPRYYDRLLEKLDPDKYREIKLDRELKRPDSEADNTQDRMKIKKRVHQLNIKRLRRSYED